MRETPTIESTHRRSSADAASSMVMILCLLSLTATLAAAFNWLIQPDAPGLPSLGVGVEPAWWRLVILMVEVGAFLVVAFPHLPAMRHTWPRDLPPLALAMALLTPGTPLMTNSPLPPESTLAGLLVVTLWWRRHRPGWRTLIATVRAALPGKASRLAVLGTGVILLVALLNIQLEEMNNVATRNTDFVTFLNATTTFWAGGDPYRDLRGFLYPPGFAFWFWPLATMPPVAASLLWFVVKLTLVIWTFQLVHGLLRGHELSARRRGWFLVGVVAVAARFWITDQQYGNTNNLILFLIVGALAWSTARPWRSGLCLALAISVKVIPGVLCVYLVAARRWRALSWTVGLSMLLNLLPIAVAPTTMSQAWSAYTATQIRGSVTERRDQPDNQSLWGALARELPAETSTLRTIWLASSLLLLAMATVATLRARRRGWLAEAMAAAIWPVLALLVSPGSWVVHYVAMLLPMAALLRWLLSADAGQVRFLWFLFWCANLLLTSSGWWRWSVRLSIDHSLFVMTALILMMVLCWLAGWARPVGRGSGRPGQGAAAYSDP